MSNENIESELNPENENLQIENDSAETDNEPVERDQLSESETEEQSKYKDGDLLKFLKVRFPGNAKSFPFLIGNRKFHYGQKVVAMSDRGVAVGYINSFPYEYPFDKSMLPLKYIQKVANDEDIAREKEHIQNERNAEEICLRLIEKHQLDMNLTHVEFTQFGKKSVFYFNAPARVDFRNLVKDLVGELKMRIELRQISVRDRAAAIGGIGACGLQLCCSYFLQKYGNVGIKMAKNQNLTLIQSKLNGVCGQLKCCLQYEDDVYSEKRENLPREGMALKVKNGDIGKVTRIHVLQEQFELLTIEGKRRRYSIDQYLGPKSTVDHFEIPESVRHFTNETANLICDIVPTTSAESDANYSYFKDNSPESTPEPKEQLESVEPLKTEAALPSNKEKPTSDSNNSDRPRKNNRFRNKNRNRNNNRNNNSKK